MENREIDKELELEEVNMYVLFTRMFADITREVEKTCGEEGIKAVREGVRQFGLARGKDIARRAKLMGHENDVTHYLSCYDMARSGHFSSDNDIKEKSIEQTFSKCIFAEQFTRDQNEKYGIHYCEIIDGAIAEGYNENFKCLHDKHFFKDSCCHFVFEMENK